MTFSALTYLVWYQKHKSVIKDSVNVSDFSAARTKLESLIAEHESAFPVNDHSTRNSELLQMKHALLHLESVLKDDATVDEAQYNKVIRILDEEVESVS